MSGGASPSASPSNSSYTMEPASPQPPQGCPNSVLRIIIENMLYPITIDVLHQVGTCVCVCNKLVIKMYMYVTAVPD